MLSKHRSHVPTIPTESKALATEAEKKHQPLVHQLSLLCNHLVLWHDKITHQRASWLIPVIQGWP